MDTEVAWKGTWGAQGLGPGLSLRPHWRELGDGCFSGSGRGPVPESPSSGAIHGHPRLGVTSFTPRAMYSFAGTLRFEESLAISFTRERSLVRNQPRPFYESLLLRGFCQRLTAENKPGGNLRPALSA